MAVNPYQQCPCGSGKQFKWCCQPYYHHVEKAEQLLEQKQVVKAGETFAKLVQEFPKTPQAWMYQAEFFYADGKPEAAEAAIQKALDLDPNFPMAHWFKGLMRENEGEYTGALILYRKAAEYLPNEAKERLALVYSRIAEIELGFGKPIAGRYALDQSVRCLPQSPELRQSHDRIFGPESHLPAAAREAYVLRPAPTPSDSWDLGLRMVAEGKPVMGVAAFDELCKTAPSAASWFNFGVMLAYIGDNRKALDALYRAIELAETPDAEAGALCEVLRCAKGLEGDADYVTHRAMLEIRDPDAVGTLLNSLGEQQRIVGLNVDRENGVFNCLVLEQTTKFGVNVGVTVARVAAQMLIHRNQMLLWHSNKAMLEQVITEMRDVVNVALGEPEFLLAPAEIANPITEMLAFPTSPNVESEQWANAREEQLRPYFEETWLSTPLKSLAGATPLDAAAHPTYKKRLAGVILFLEQILTHFGTPQEDGTRVGYYDFNRLRRKLGLLEGAPVLTGTAAKAKIDFDLLSAADLGGIDPTTLTDDQVGEGYRAALRLDAPDLAGKFAMNATTRASIADRYPYFSHLVKLAKEAGDANATLQLLEQGEAADAATNEGKRRGVYAINRGKALAATDIAKAAEVFRTAIAVTPNDIDLYAPAAETMLGKKAGKDALAFAEQGLTKAREQNNRDAEQQFMELVTAAKKLVG